MAKVLTILSYQMQHKKLIDVAQVDFLTDSDLDLNFIDPFRMTPSGNSHKVAD